MTLRFEQLDALELDTRVVQNVEKLYETYDLEDKKHFNEIVENREYI